MSNFCMEWTRLIARLLLCIFVTICLLSLGVYGHSCLQLRRAQKLAASFAVVPVGKLLGPEFAVEFPKSLCLEGSCYRGTEVTNLPFAAYWPEVWRVSRLVSSRFWSVGAQLKVDPNGKVLNKMLVIDDGKYRQFSIVEVRVGFDTFSFDPCLSASQFRHPGYNPRRIVRTGTLAVDLAPDAARQFTERAFQLDLSCLNTHQRCRPPADIAPEAWADQEEDRRLLEHDREQNREVLRSCPVVSAPVSH